MKIWIDADACPNTIKEVIYKAAVRLNITTILVANKSIHTPKLRQIRVIVVEKGPDVADAYIVDQVQITDLVITADIPLADLIVKKGAVALNPRGELYSEQNIRERLSMRDFHAQVREAGYITGGPASLNDQDKKKFAAAFDRILQKLRSS